MFGKNKENNNNGMPVMNGNPNVTGDSEKSSSPIVESPAGSSTESSATSPAEVSSVGEPALTPPEHGFQEEDVDVIDPSETNSDVNIPLAPVNGIEVVATRKGFYGQKRRSLGEKFKIKDFSQLGTWMQCIDPILEKQRGELLEKKKASN